MDGSADASCNAAPSHHQGTASGTGSDSESPLVPRLADLDL